MTNRGALPDLDQVLADAKARWLCAVRDRHSPFHTPVVCSAQDAVAHPRIMVLRDVQEGCTALRFHTDARSAKTAHIGAGAPVTVLGYDPEARIQLTLRGMGRIETDGAAADAAWAASAPSSRRCYLAAFAPGTETASPTSGLPDHLLNRAPTAAESEAGRPNFAIVMIEALEMEWLKLTSCGNQRARFRRDDDIWHGQWITP